MELQIIEQLISELNKVKDMEKQLQFALIEKKNMSELLYKTMTYVYLTRSYDERVKEHKEDVCRTCRSQGMCHDQGIIKLPDDILMPVPSDKNYIPGRKICESFEWD